MSTILKHALLITLTLASFVSFSHAADMPLPPRPVPQPQPEEPEEQPEELPEHPRPTPPECRNECGQQVIQRTVHVNCPVSFNYLNIGQIFNLGQRYQGYALVAVTAQILGGVNGTQLSLVVNNQLHGSFYNPWGAVVLTPQYPVILDYYSQNILLQVNGTLNVSSLTITLRAPYSGPY